MPEGTVLVTVDHEVATVTLNRPDIHNAFNDEIISRLTRELKDLADDRDVRVVVLAARGKSFCAGADLNYMKKTAAFSTEENVADARALAELLVVLGTMPQPTVALIQGPAYGGGVGLICACDVAIAAESASFALTEVRLGLIPAVISPFVINTIGESHSRRYILTGERISARVAERIRLVHEVVHDDTLTVRGDTIVRMLLKGSPDAHRRAKDLIAAVRNKPVDAALADDVATRIADARASDDGQEGINAFLEKRKPRWQL
jgi:methylglutaconyl-CoA hydratase